MLGVVGFKVPMKKSSNDIYIKIFKPVFQIFWLKQRRESNEVGEFLQYCCDIRKHTVRSLLA